MAQGRKLLLKALNNPTNLRFREFTSLVEAFDSDCFASRAAITFSPVNLFLNEADGLWIAGIPDLPGCSAHGDTPEAALREVQLAKEGWIEVAAKIGKSIPPPSYRPAIYQAG